MYYLSFIMESGKSPYVSYVTQNKFSYLISTNKLSLQ